MTTLDRQLSQVLYPTSRADARHAARLRTRIVFFLMRRAIRRLRATRPMPVLRFASSPAAVA